MSTEVTTQETRAERALDPKAAVPVILFLFVFCLVVDNGFKFISKPIADDLGLSVTTVSLQATLAGIIIGIGAVVYATLADFVSIRRLLCLAVGLICAGSLFGYVMQSSFPAVLAGRIVQTAGLAAAETLYVIYVTKYLDRKDQKTYLGFSAAAFQLSLLVGALTSGFIATYIHWTALFLVPLVLLATLPSVVRRVPKQAATAGSLDVLGVFLVAVIATGVMLFLQDFVGWYLLLVVAAVAVFAWHIATHEGALVDRSFFRNARYTSMLAVVFVMYSVQLAYIFAFPFLVTSLYGYTLSDVSLLLVPGYACAATVGALSGHIARVLDSRHAITLSMLAITASLVVPAVVVDRSVAVLVASMVLFACGFALMYAPLVATAIRDIPAERSGVAIGFYNLTINIAVPIGIAYTAKLLDAKPTLLSGLSVAGSETAAVYSTVLWIIAGVSVVGLVAYRVAIAALHRRDRAAA